MRSVYLLLYMLAMAFFSQNGFSREKNERASVAIKEIKRERLKAEKGKRSPGIGRSHTLERTVEKKLIKGISQTISYLKKTADQMPKRSGGRLEMLTKILNLRLEQASYESFEEQSTYDEAWQTWQKNGKKGPEPKLNNERSNIRWQQLIEEANSVLKEFPKGKNTDAINFDLALALQFLGKDAASAQAFSQLIKNYPKSTLVGDAYFFLGEYYFDKSDFASALKNYRSAMRYKRSKRYGWSIFKTGWAYYNLGQYKKAIAYWRQTVSYSKQMGGQVGSRLADEALRDMIYAFAELRMIEEAIRYYRENSGEEYIPKFLKLLATILTEHGEFREAIAVWHKLLKIVPYSEEAIDAQREIIALYFDSKEYQKVWAELVTLVENYNSKSPWGQKNPQLVEEAEQKNQELLLYYPKKVHQDAQKNGDKSYFAAAKAGYLLYLKYYSKSKDFAEIKEYIGDIDYFQSKFEEAGKTYMEIGLLGKDKAVVYDEKGQIKNNIHKRSAKNMLDAFNQEFLPELKSLLKIKPDFKQKPRVLSERAKNFIKSCELYTQWYPEDIKTVKNCDVYVGEIYYRTNNKDQARKSLWTIASKYPKSKEGHLAAENLVPLYTDDKAQLVKVAANLLAIDEYRNSKLGKKLTLLVKEIQIEQIKSETDPAKRAAMYETQAKSKDGGGNDVLWNNAATDYIKAGEITKAIAAYGVIVNKYPDSPAFKLSLLQLGKLSDRRLDYGSASDYYFAFAKKFPSEKESPGALQRSCQLLVAIESPKALTTCFEFAKKYPEAGILTIENLIMAAWRKTKYDLMSEIILKYYLPHFKLNNSQKILAYYRIFKGLGERSAQGQEALRQITQISSAGGLSGESLRYAGEVLFLRANSVMPRFMSLRLQGGSLEKLQGSIGQLTQGVSQVEQAFAPIFKIQDSYWAVAAFHQVGLAYEHFANEMQNPPAINGASVNDVKNQLQASVDQVLAKSNEYYNTGIQTARRYEIYSPWTVKVFDALNRLARRTVTFEEWVILPDFLASEIVSEEIAGLQYGKK